MEPSAVIHGKRSFVTVTISGDADRNGSHAGLLIHGRFIAYDNGTVLDTLTNRMWAAKDNGSDIDGANAKSYYENYRGCGYSDWRMPTQDELANIYDRLCGRTLIF